MSPALAAWLGAWAFTILAEAPVYALALRRAGRPWVLALTPSLLTHPVVWFLFPRLFPGRWLEATLMAEAFAVGAEALLLSALGVMGSIRWALAANALSVALGLTSRALLGWP